MLIRYDQLWKLFIDKKKKKNDLMRMANISSNALAHLSKDESVSVMEFSNIETKERASV